MTHVLKIDNLGKTYRRRRRSVTALSAINLELRPGELRFVHGPSGSGKSTLLLCAGGLLQPDTGTVKINGQDLYAMGAEQRAALRARHIGFVFQQFHLIPYLNVIENVMTLALAGSAVDLRKRAEELIERFGLADRRKHPPAELSIGERQRVALARALVGKPQLLLADEPTGNLDTANGDLAMNCLREFAEAGGAVMLVTHDRKQIPADAFNLNGGKLQS